MSFLPPDYEAPAEGGKYYKITKGENRFRILGGAIVGNEYWTEIDGKRKPIRKRIGERISLDEIEDGDASSIKHFWAFPVWDSADATVKIFEVTQKSIRQAIQKYVDDEEWGDPTKYDFSITREGEGLETRYTVITKPAKELTKEQVSAWKEVMDKGFDLDELFRSGDPFNPTTAPASDEINIDDIPFE